MDVDITESLKQTISEQKLAISQISHEIRNPVTLIHSSLQLIEKEHPEVCDFAFWKETMQDMQYLIRLLEEVSHYNNGGTLHIEAIPLNQWLQDILRTPCCFASKNQQLICNLAPDLPVLMADAVKLRQAISNLLRNAFESLEGDGVVTFTAAVSEKTLILKIADTGCGIPSIYLDTLFHPFVTHKKSGTGLGLPISKRIIEAHGGTLTLESTEGQGTVFTIHLPL